MDIKISGMVWMRKKCREWKNWKDGDKNYGKVVVMVTTTTLLPTSGTTLVSIEICDSDLVIPRYSSGNIGSVGIMTFLFL